MSEYQPRSDCHEWIKVDEAVGGGVLACWLDAGHEDLHYDEVDDVSWKRGRP